MLKDCFDPQGQTSSKMFCIISQGFCLLALGLALISGWLTLQICLSNEKRLKSTKTIGCLTICLHFLAYIVEEVVVSWSSPKVGLVVKDINSSLNSVFIMLIYRFFLNSLLGIIDTDKKTKKLLLLPATGFIAAEFLRFLVPGVQDSFCTKKHVVILRIVVSLLTFLYFCMGQWIGYKAIGLVISHMESFKSSMMNEFDKFSGMDLRFLVNQIFK